MDGKVIVTVGLLLTVINLCALAQPAGLKGQPLLISQAPDDFQRWFIWDTVPDRPGLVRRFDVATYLGKPVCSVEDTSLSHDPRFASPPFAIPKDQWLLITATIASDKPHHFFTLAFEYQQRDGDRVVTRLSLPFTVFASDRWRTANLLAPPASLVAPKADYTHAQLYVRPVLYGQYAGQCHAWHIKTGRVHLARIQVEALPSGFEPVRDSRRGWFEFATQLLPKWDEGRGTGGEKNVQSSAHSTWHSAPILASFEFLHERPAGKKGFVRLHPDGYLVFEDGTPLRLWGVGWHENYFW